MELLSEWSFGDAVLAMLLGGSIIILCAVYWNWLRHSSRSARRRISALLESIRHKPPVKPISTVTDSPVSVVQPSAEAVHGDFSITDVVCLKCYVRDEQLRSRGYCRQCATPVAARPEPDSPSRRVKYELPKPPPKSAVMCEVVDMMDIVAKSSRRHKTSNQAYHQFLEKQHRKTRHTVIGALLAIATPFAAILSFCVCAYGLTILTDTDFSSLGQTVKTGPALLALSVGYGFWHWAKRYSIPTAYEKLKRDRRAPVLLLRGFADDFHPLPTRETGPMSRETTLEEMLCQKFSACGPMVAVGRPGERIPPLGAARAYIPDEQWQATVQQIVEQAQYVVVVLGRLTPGLYWEMELLFQRTDLRKLILVMPPLDETLAQMRWETYVAFAPQLLPDYQSGLLAMRWTTDRHAEMVCTGAEGWFSKRTAARDDSAYEFKLLIL